MSLQIDLTRTVSCGQLKSHDAASAVNFKSICSVKEADPVDQLGPVVLPWSVPDVHDCRDARWLNYLDLNRQSLILATLKEPDMKIKKNAGSERIIRH